jgi:glycosyltransferase involved in cell wall biosynthesis
MKILMLAPQPFFQPRGTPISVYFRLHALSSLGHEVDLVTYHLGEDKEFPHVRILRIPNLMGIKTIKIGPSWKKLPLDLFLLLKTTGRLFRKRYDLIFSHEEAGWFGTALARIWRIPHVYDMHSSLPQQLDNFSFSRSKWIKRIFLRLEAYVLKNSQAVIVICQDLLDQVEKAGHARKATLLENFLDFEAPAVSPDELAEMREQYAGSGQKIVLYTGNFQPYQGIELLLEAAARLAGQNLVFLLVGDTPEAVAEMKVKAQDRGVEEMVCFTGQVPPEQVPLYIKLSDVLVSPRLSGTNTPLKIYSFLKSGKPLVATNLWTHTQVLDPKIAILAEPDPESLAAGIHAAAFSEEAQARVKNALALSEREYTFPRYLEKLRKVLVRAETGRKKASS